SLSTGKACPGDNRIRQINNEIIPRVVGILNGLPPQQPQQPTNPVSEVDEMPFEISAPNRSRRLVLGGHIVGWDNGARRSRVIKAFQNKNIPVPNVELSTADYDYVSKRTSYQDELDALVTPGYLAK